MGETFEPLVKKYHVFYEVGPYHILVEKAHGSPTAMCRPVRGGSGFTVWVYRVSSFLEFWKMRPSSPLRQAVWTQLLSCSHGTIADGGFIMP